MLVQCGVRATHGPIARHLERTQEEKDEYFGVTRTYWDLQRRLYQRPDSISICIPASAPAYLRVFYEDGNSETGVTMSCCLVHERKATSGPDTRMSEIVDTSSGIPFVTCTGEEFVADFVSRISSLDVDPPYGLGILRLHPSTVD